MRQILYLLSLLLLSSIGVSAQVITMDSHLEYKNLGKQIHYFEDKTAGLTLDEVIAIEKQGRFTKGKENIFNFGNTKSAFWLKLDYQSKGTSQDFLVIGSPNIDHIDCYTILANGKRSHGAAGSAVPEQKGVITTNSYTFDLPFQYGSSPAATIWIRVQTNNILIVPMKLATTNSFLPGSSMRYSVETIYIGVLLTLLLFNLFLFISLKDNTYLYYSIYVLCLSVYVLVFMRGYGFVCGDEFRIFINRYPHSFLGYSIIASILFSWKFLNIREVLPKLVLPMYLLLGASILMIITSILGYKSIASTMAQATAMVGSTMLWITGLLTYLKGHKPAKYFILAWTFITITVVIVVLSLAGVIAYTDMTSELVPIGSTLELLLLSFALGDRYRTLIENEKRVREENLQLIEHQKQRLKALVDGKTIKLKRTIAELEASNAVKNKLFSIIAHDLKSPFNSLISIFSLKDMDLLDFEELKMLLNENRRNIESIQNTLINLLYWAKSQMDEIKAQPTVFDLKAKAESLMMVYQPLILKKGILAHTNFNGAFMVKADENQVELILRNLIDNAIKFTQKGASLGLVLERSETVVEVCVNNTVEDNSAVDLEMITTHNLLTGSYGTAGEKGIGLGLHLCREYIKENGGALDVKVNGNLVSFCFTLPSA
ncbi:MAG: sensor histidine kinase [Bacteroidota bacterium]